RRRCGTRNSERIDAFMRDMIAASRDGQIRLSDEMREVFLFFKGFMFSDVYTNPVAKGEESKVDGILQRLYDYYTARPEAMPAEFQTIADSEGEGRAAVDYISGMTDSYAMEKYGQLFIPFAWTVK
ncbi:MAG: deoxyguanosinetriphosphate triphosphohydrolase, partial [Oscillospiraceae bacterium]|nr:deoxyguanosinetriphosphate triphosphohydrolase [Oscillospiraceae bacterium]